jgi:hypothetical protein
MGGRYQQAGENRCAADPIETDAASPTALSDETRRGTS